jgi:hypothetical protein
MTLSLHARSPASKPRCVGGVLIGLIILESLDLVWRIGILTLRAMARPMWDLCSAARAPQLIQLFPAVFRFTGDVVTLATSSTRK